MFDIYDPQTDKWTNGLYNLVSTNKLLIGMGAARNEIYFISGSGTNNDVSFKEFFKYNPASKSLSKISNINDSSWLMGTVSLHDSIYFIGGIKGAFPDGEKLKTTLLLRIVDSVGFQDSIITGFIEDSFHQDISIFPNPFQEEVFLSMNDLSAKKEVKVQILDLMGNVLNEQVLTSKSEKIKILESDKTEVQGIYIYKIFLDNKIYAGKLFKSSYF